MTIGTVVPRFKLFEFSLGAKFQWLVSILGIVGDHPKDGGWNTKSTPSLTELDWNLTKKWEKKKEFVC